MFGMVSCPQFNGGAYSNQFKPCFCDLALKVVYKGPLASFHMLGKWCDDVNCMSYNHLFVCDEQIIQSSVKFRLAL